MSETLNDTGKLTGNEPLPLLLRGPLIGLKPGEGRVVRKPDGQALSADGEMVNVDDAWIYWVRRIEDADVIIDTSQSAANLNNSGDEA